MPTLNSVRFYTENDAYHYMVDNRPLQDLSSNIEIINDYLDQNAGSTVGFTAAGNWSTLSIVLNMQQNLGKPFAYKFKIWGIKDSSQSTSQSATLSEDIIFGFADIAGNVTIQQVNNIFSQSLGTGTLAKTYLGGNGILTINFSGYTGINGYVVLKAERFGI